MNWVSLFTRKEVLICSLCISSGVSSGLLWLPPFTLQTCYSHTFVHFFPYINPFTPSTRLHRPQVPFFKSSVWPDFGIRPRGVTRLNGAGGKKQVWRRRVRTWGLSEANLLYWRKYLWHCWGFSVIIDLVIRRQGSCAPLATPLIRTQSKNFSAAHSIPLHRSLFSIEH